MLLLLVRHGVTDHVGVKLSGWTSGVHLSKAGRDQAARVAERLSGVKLDALYSSPLDRTVQTAEAIAKSQKLRVRKRNELGEVHYGGIEGKSLRVLAKTKMWKRLVAWPSDVRFPDGESLRETQARAVAAVERLRADHPGKTVAVVSHGDWIRLTMAHYLGVHIDLYRRIVIDPASVSAIRFFEYTPIVTMMNGIDDLTALAPGKESRR